MPTIYRSMLADGDKPKIGNSAKTLGVRTLGEHPDIPVSDKGIVQGSMGGMSVSPNWRALPVHRIPKRLKHVFPRARGKNELFCWRYGEGEFEDGPLAKDLSLRLDPAKPDRHGFVEPDKNMKLSQYEAALASTQEQWTIDED